MKIQYQLEQRADHIRVVALGIYDALEALQVLREAIEAALAHKQTKVLVDCRELTGTPGTMQRFDLADTITRFYHERRGSSVIRLAIVGTEPLIDPVRFGETVAHNRGFPIKVTTDLDEALSWLALDSAK
jgi:hypothetical protein